MVVAMDVSTQAMERAGQEAEVQVILATVPPRQEQTTSEEEAVGQEAEVLLAVQTEVLVLSSSHTQLPSFHTPILATAQ